MMFATKLLLKYAVKPCSPPRAFVPPEGVQTVKPLIGASPVPKLYTTARVNKSSEPKAPIPDLNSQKSLHLDRSKLCSRSEPRHAGKRKWSQLEQSIVDHPNFEKAAALVQLLNDNAAAKKHNPHRIGSLPTGKAPFQSSPETRTVQAAVNVVKDLIISKESETEEVEVEETSEEKPKIGKIAKSSAVESVELQKPKVETKRTKQKKPYVINIYLDTKQTKILEDADIKKKIKEFWYENMVEFERKQQNTDTKTTEVKPVASVPVLAPSLSEVPPPEIEEEMIEEELKQKRSLKKRSNLNYNNRYNEEELEEIEDARDTLEDVPKYQIENVKKIYPDLTSTANPHTERLHGGTPPNYDLGQKIKDMLTSSTVTPVNTSGFSKYLGIWKKLWSKKQDEKDQTVEENDVQTYSSDNVEDDQAKQAFKLIEHDKIFRTKKKMKFNPYDPQLKKYEDDEEDMMKTEAKNLEGPDVENIKRKPSPKYQRRYYSSTCTEQIPADDNLNCKTRATTHLQITEYQNNNEYQQKMSYSTKANGGNADSKPSEKETKTGQARVENFVDKFKNALAIENKREFKKIQIVYDPNSQDKNKRQVKVEIMKADATGGNYSVQKKDERRENRGGKAHSAKKRK